MPYVIEPAKQKGKYYVVTESTGVKHSKKGIPKERAEAQMRLLYAIENGYKLKKKKPTKM